MTDIQDLLLKKMFVVNNSLCGSSGCQASVIASFVNNNKSFNRNKKLKYEIRRHEISF